MSCCVMVEPPAVPEPRNILAQAFIVVIQSTPWCSRKRLSSMAMQAWMRLDGMSSYFTHVRFAPP